jgi:hypothetical protein
LPPQVDQHPRSKIQSEAPPAEGKACATAAAALHPPISANDDGETRCESGNSMRAEIQSLVDEIKQSLGLLRRHL